MVTHLHLKQKNLTKRFEKSKNRVEMQPNLAGQLRLAGYKIFLSNPNGLNSCNRSKKSDK